MDPSMPGSLVREGLSVLAIAGGPLFVALLVTGLVVGVLQAATQVNDPAVGFLPRILVALLVIWLVGPWAAERLAGFLAHAMSAMGSRPL